MIFRIVSYLVHFIVIVVSLIILSSVIANATPIPNVFINEIHYDNLGGDQDEFIEVAGESGTNLNGWSLYFYNGSNGESYKSHLFGDWLLSDVNNGFDFAGVFITGIQNGSPDGIVLADPDQNVVQFLSYEGSFTATAGIASGLTSTDIGVGELSDTPVGFSLQLEGQGSQYDDFNWASPQQNTFGTSNTEQTFLQPDNESIEVNEPKSVWLMLSLLILYFVRNSPLSWKHSVHQ